MTGSEQGVWVESETDTDMEILVHTGQGAPLSGTAAEAEKRAETEETKRMKEKFGFFGPAAFIYAVFYTFCMYRNGSGVTFPFFVAGSLLFFCLSLAKLEITLKKGSVFYMAAMVLLGVSTFCTDDQRIIFFNKLGIFLLMMSLLLKQYFETSKWGPGKFLGSILRLVFGVRKEMAEPFHDGAAYWTKYREREGGRLDGRIWAVGLGLLAGIPLLFVVVLLLSSADALFRRMAGSLVTAVVPGNVANVLLRISMMFLASYCLTASLCRRNIQEEVKDRRTGEPVLAITVTGMLTALYLVFCVIQINGLFLGRMQLPEGYTYAAYAREGFFQLLAVSFLNLVIVLVCLGLFKDSRVLKCILMVMSVCTFVMIASSAMRMIMYIQCYYLTFLRILVLWSLALLALLFAGVLINVFKSGFPLFRYSVAVVTVLYLALSFAHPDYLIARVNLADAAAAEGREGGADSLDYQYLSGLCADAAPVLVPYMEELGYRMETRASEETPGEYNIRMDGSNAPCGMKNTFGYHWLEKMQERTENFGARTFNLSRYRMLRLLQQAAAFWP